MSDIEIDPAAIWRIKPATIKCAAEDFPRDRIIARDTELSAIEEAWLAISRLPVHIQRRIVTWLKTRVESDAIDVYAQQMEKLANTQGDLNIFVAPDGRVCAASRNFPLPAEVAQ
jgi:hypothetical protein